MIYAGAVTVAMLRRRRQLAQEMMERREAERAAGRAHSQPRLFVERPHYPSYGRFIANDFRHMFAAIGRLVRRTPRA